MLLSKTGYWAGWSLAWPSLALFSLALHFWKSCVLSAVFQKYCYKRQNYRFCVTKIVLLLCNRCVSELFEPLSYCSPCPMGLENWLFLWCFNPILLVFWVKTEEKYALCHDEFSCKSVPPSGWMTRVVEWEHHKTSVICWNNKMQFSTW